MNTPGNDYHSRHGVAPADKRSGAESLLDSSSVHSFHCLDRDIAYSPSTMEVICLGSIDRQILEISRAARGSAGVIAALSARGFPPDATAGAIARLKGMGFLGGDCPAPATVPQRSTFYSLTLNVAQKCNLACRYCYSDNDKGQLMSKEVASRAIDFFLEEFPDITSLSVIFYGGEPLLNFDTLAHAVVHAEKRARERDLPPVKFHLTTNGTLLTEGIIKFLEEHPFKVSVSIDGPKAGHDSMRLFRSGEGSFDEVFRNFKRLLASRHIKVGTSSVITEKNCMISAHRFFSPFPLSDMKFSHATNFCDGQDKLTDGFKRDYMKDLETVARECVDKLLLFERPPAYNFEQRILMLWRKKHKEHFCPASTLRFGFSVTGEIFPCGPSTSLGENCLGDIYNGFNREGMSRFRNYLNYTNDPRCDACWAKDLCMGGCPLPQRSRVERQHCDLMKYSTELAIAVFAAVREKNEVAFTVLVDPEFARRIKELAVG